MSNETSWDTLIYDNEFSLRKYLKFNDFEISVNCDIKHPYRKWSELNPSEQKSITVLIDKFGYGYLDNR